MSSLRFARSALRARPSLFSAPIQRRGYAEAVPDKIKLSLALPHQVREPLSITTPMLTFHPSHRLSTARLACMWPLCLRSTWVTLISSNTDDPSQQVPRSTSPPPPVRWVSLPTTSPPSNSSSLVLSRLLRRAVPPSSTSVRPILALEICRQNEGNSQADLAFCAVSGGFAVVQPDSQLSINAVEGFPLEEFSSEVGFSLSNSRHAHTDCWFSDTGCSRPDCRGPEDC